MERGKKDEPNRSASEGFLKPYYESIKNLSIQDIPFETTIPTMWNPSVKEVPAKELMQLFIDKGIFNNDYFSPELPLRNLLR